MQGSQGGAGCSVTAAHLPGPTGSASQPGRDVPECQPSGEDSTRISSQPFPKLFSQLPLSGSSLASVRQSIIQAQADVQVQPGGWWRSPWWCPHAAPLSPRLCPGVPGTRQGLETRPEAGPAQGVWGPCSLPASPHGLWPAPSQRRHQQPWSCVAVSPGRECPQGLHTPVRTSLWTCCLGGGVHLAGTV